MFYFIPFTIIAIYFGYKFFDKRYFAKYEIFKLIKNSTFRAEKEWGNDYFDSRCSDCGERIFHLYNEAFLKTFNGKPIKKETYEGTFCPSCEYISREMFNRDRINLIDYVKANLK